MGINTFQALMKKIQKFQTDRDWKQYNNAKDLSLSICLEAAELLENFQWISPEEGIKNNFQNIKEELSDVLIYSLQLAMELDIDLLDEASKKIDKNAMRYPVQK